MLPALETTPQVLVLIALGAYLLGSIPFGMVVARMMGLGNLRDIGSGNIGATNVLRTGNKAAAFLTLLFDAGKGGVAVLLAGHWFAQDAAQIAGLCAFLGHLFPVWLRFNGGKGVATFLGILLSLGFSAGFAACMSWLAVAIVFRFSSLAALIAALSAPIWLIFWGPQAAVALMAVLAVLVWLRHRENIARLLSGSESKIGAK